MRKFFGLTSFVFLFSCGDDLGGDDGNDPKKPPIPPDVHETRIDASSEDTWSAFDLDTGEVVADGTPGWDLAFQRTWAIANGEACVMVARLPDASLDEIDEAPASGWLRDGSSREAEWMGGYAFHGEEAWYVYDFASHEVSPRGGSYVVLSDEGRAYALSFTDYYDDAGTSGYPTFHWKEIEVGAASGACGEG